MNEDDDGMLKAVLFSQFDNIVGPKIVLQAPKDYLSTKDFENVSDYIITEKPCGRLVTLTANGHTIMCYPM